MLKYLFIAQYNDGTEFRQNENDVSSQDSKRSAFFDIIQEKLVRFSLVGDGRVFSVDLTDGHFEINGIPFRMHDESIENIRLIFFRKHTHNYNLALEEQSHDIIYRMGWQANLHGSNTQRVMEID